VGLPGETLERFEELMAFVKGTQFERLGAFAYSPEAGTAAATLDGQVPAGETIRRLDELMLAHQQIALEHAQSRVGQKIECVVDAASAGGRWSGRTYGDAPEIDTIIELTGRGLHPGAFGTATVTAANGYDLAGRMDVRDDDQPAESGHA
jgi:ribosomal protein S12 methylthiotransferase